MAELYFAAAAMVAGGLIYLMGYAWASICAFFSRLFGVGAFLDNGP